MEGTTKLLEKKYEVELAELELGWGEMVVGPEIAEMVRRRH